MNEEIWAKSCHISPSMITLDMCNLEQQCRMVEEAGLEMIHVDILDGHFSPSMPLGLDAVKQLRKKTNLEFEAHVMVTEPQFIANQPFPSLRSKISFANQPAPEIFYLTEYSVSETDRPETGHRS